MNVNGDPQSGKMLVGASITLAVFAVIGGSTYWAGYWSLGSGTGYQPTGDPPVTISDGSLHAKDVNGWDNPDTGATAYQLVARTASGNTGTIVAGKTCGVSDGNKISPTYFAAAFWATDQNAGEYPPTEVTAGSTIIIHHDPNDAKKDGGGNPKDQIIITVPPGPSAGQLTIDSSNAAASDGFFFGEDPTTDSTNGSHNRRHSRPGNVSSIVVKNSSGKAYITWPKSGKLSNQAHFSLGFCFQ